MLPFPSSFGSRVRVQLVLHLLACPLAFPLSDHFPTNIVLYVAPQVPTTFPITLLFSMCIGDPLSSFHSFVSNRPDSKVRLQRVYDSSHLIYPMISKMSL